MSTRFTDEELNDSMDKYADSYNDNDFWSIVKTYGKTIGSGVIVKVLELYYLLQKAGIPNKIKVMIMGALAYLICPVDLIPDVLPLIGWTDDATAISLVVNQLGSHIDGEITDLARKKTEEIFG